MDINNFYQSNNDSFAYGNSTASPMYDVAAEKQRIALGIEEIKKELAEKFKKKFGNSQIFPISVTAMHPGIVDFLLSFNLVSVYDDIARQANLDAKGRNALPHIVWKLAETKNWSALDQVLENEIPLVHSAHMQVANLLKQNILSKVQAVAESPAMQKIVENQVATRKETQLSITEALSQYPKIGEQSITSEQIKLRYFSAPVRPSIKNWMTDFHDAMGAMKHSPIDRGNFLFHSENGKKLSPTDRQKLGVILKSLDEKTLLTVDPEMQVVVFAEMENAQNANKISAENQNSVLASNTNSIPRSVQAPVYRREPIEGDNVEQIQVQREARPDINLRQNEVRPQPSSQTVFQSPRLVSAPVAAIKAEQPPKQYFPKPVVENRIENKMAAVRDMPPISKSTERKDDFFAIAQSKPPIGSEHFNAAPSPAKETVVSEKIQDRDSMSDELLYQALQNKNGVGQTAATQGMVSFSSAQKLPAEQIAKQPTQVIKNSPYHIAPTPHLYEKKETTPKIQGNIVDLKN